MENEDDQNLELWLWKAITRHGFWARLIVTVALGAWLVWAKLVAQLWLKPAKTRSHFSRQGVVGPPPKPLLGNMKEIGELMAAASAEPMIPPSHNILPRVLSFYHQWKTIYGATFLIWFGPIARLTISDPSHIREVLTTSSDLYEKYEAHPLVKKLEGDDSLVNLNGQKWAHRRKILSPIFHLQNLKLMMPIMAQSVTDMLDKWSLTCTSGKAEIEVFESFQNLTEEVITRAIFGGCYDDGKTIYQLQNQQIIFASESFQKVSIPGFRFLPTRRNRTTWRIDREIQTLLMRLIEKKRESLKERGPVDEAGPQDLLEKMIMESLKEKGEDGIEIKVGDIMDECKSFFFAGKNTTSSLLVWTTVLLAMHPRWQLLAREEVLRVCGTHDAPTKDDVSNLKTLGMIIYEALRLYTPVVATIRRTKANVRLGEFNIPEKTELLIPTLGVHHDPNVWGPDVYEFNPARFSHGVARAAQHPNAYLPFGLGARQCIGQNLAILQAKLAVAMILQRFSFEPSPEYKHAPSVLMILYPQFNAPILFQRL